MNYINVMSECTVDSDSNTTNMKINPFDYLFYKVYKFLSFISYGGGTTERVSAISILSLLFALNLLMLLSLIFDTVSPPIFTACSFFIVIFNLIYYNLKDDIILTKYSQESEHSRTVGNMIVTVYVILTFVMLIWTA